MNKVNLPEDPTLAGKVIDAEAERESKKLDRGMIGIMFGTKDHVPNNVAASICIICMLSICVIYARSDSFADSKDPITVISGILTLGLGFLFGRASKE
jgi:hypothetical protein